ncbi:MAG: MFS transporter [Bacteroidetes bacterium]|nr:MFS transporter [Bacteroidota bacterium]
MIEKIWNKAFILLTLSNFLMCVTYYSLISTLPVYISHELHASKSTVGLVLSSYIIASVTIRPFTGFALDNFGRKTIFLSALLLYAIIFCGYAIAFTILFMFFLRFAHGFTWGIVQISSSILAVGMIPDAKRGEGIGYYGLSATMGMAIGPLVGLFILHNWGYTALFLSGFGISLIALLCAYLIKYPQTNNIKEHKPMTVSSLFDKRSVTPSFNLTIIQITYGGLMSFIALYGHEIGIKNSSGFFLVYALGIALSRFSSGKMFDRSGPQHILTICISLLIIGFCFLAFVQNSIGFYGSAIILGIGNGVIFPTFQTMVNNLTDSDRRGAANSTLYTSLDIGMGLGMIIVGFISQHSSISAAFLVCATICLVGLIYFRYIALGHYQRYKLTAQ